MYVCISIINTNTYIHTVAVVVDQLQCSSYLVQKLEARSRSQKLEARSSTSTRSLKYVSRYSYSYSYCIPPYRNRRYFQLLEVVVVVLRLCSYHLYRQKQKYIYTNNLITILSQLLKRPTTSLFDVVQSSALEKWRSTSIYLILLYSLYTIHSLYAALLSLFRQQ